ncbi:MAG: transposase [Prevotellaceae bacterium]|jgi:REP element-mobilizing transposase RayT|nr:transposase [Prevotellaceae bacterium]
MTYNPNHRRRSIRLKGYDYSQAGLYFITMNVQHNQYLFGEITDEQMSLNAAGQMVADEWEKLPERFPNIELHEFVVMPNHFHGILEIVDTPVVDTPVVGATTVGATIVGAPLVGARHHDMDAATTSMITRATTRGAPTVGKMMDAFKSITTVEYIRGVRLSDWLPFNGKLWQRNYYEHIIRNEKSYQNIAEYIINNPVRWRNNRFNKFTNSI